MQVQLNTDSNVQGADSLAGWVEGELTQKLSRFQDQITRIEVHLSDLNAQRTTGNDKRCVMEARLAGRQPVAVDHQAANVADAVRGATTKLLRALDTALGRVRDATGRETIRGMTDSDA
jgi:ribosome-associated translation inhibitor RaiA